MVPIRLRLSSFLLLGSLVAASSASGVSFRVSYPAAAFAGPFSGRIVVMFSRGGEPRRGPNWFAPDPMLARKVAGLAPGTDEVVKIGPGTDVFPRDGKLKPGTYQVQAILDRNLGGRSVGASPGNLYSKPSTVVLDSSGEIEIALVCDQVVEEPAFVDTESVKEIRLPSPSLSRFYGRPTFLRAAVAVPPAYRKDPKRKFPVLYIVPGFGGNHFGWSGRTSVGGSDRGGEPFIQVLLNPDCPTGHSVFADSANNGPWGLALTKELIPAIEKQYRTYREPGARFVTGHSSGGWSSLWLQVAYPNVFGGTWSTSPDPVDFRDFQRIDLYAPSANMFTDAEGKPRPIARVGSEPKLFYQGFSDMEAPLARGEQLVSFEGVFSPKGEDGQPQKLWDRSTGKVDPKVAESWKKYDIGYILRTQWQKLRPLLKGKLHVYTGDMDTFYLEGAVKLLKEDLKILGADASVEVFPGDHGSVLTRELRDRIDREMAASYRRWKATR